MLSATFLIRWELRGNRCMETTLEKVIGALTYCRPHVPLLR